MNNGVRMMIDNDKPFFMFQQQYKINILFCCSDGSSFQKTLLFEL